MGECQAVGLESMAYLGNNERLVWGKPLFQIVEEMVGKIRWGKIMEEIMDGMGLEDIMKGWKRLSKSEWDQRRGFLEQKVYDWVEQREN